MESQFDPFFVSRIREGKCVLFAGAGISVAAGYPNWASLIEGLMDAASKSHPGIELSVARTLISEDELLEAAAYLREEMGTPSFFSALRDLLQKAQVEPSATHKLLARFPFRAILTTNFDQLIEQATDGTLPVATQNDAKDLAKYLNNGSPFLFKVHGDIDRPDTIVLTPEEFTEVTVQNEAYKRSFSALVLTSTLLFIGYSHTDPDLDLFLREHVLIFGKEGARRYALMQVRDEKDAILQRSLRHKSIQVIPYADHDQVPTLLEQLLKAVETQTEQTTTTPPRLAPPRARDPGLRRRATPPRSARNGRFVIVIPGLGGSKLSTIGSTIWLSFMQILRGGIAKLDLRAKDAPRIMATELLGQFAQTLVATLDKQHQVLPFAYDWRLDYRENADRLNAFIAQEVPDDARCDLVALAQGGLLARSFVAEYRGTWRRMQKNAGGRLVMLGTANHGTFDAVRILIGDSSFIAKVALLDLRHSRERIRRIFATFPSIYQSLPSPQINAAWNAFFRSESYGRFEVESRLLEDALRFQDEIADAVDPDRMFIILGDGMTTVTSVEDPARLDRERQLWWVTSDGDGSVAHQYGRLAKNGREAPTYYASVDHGALGNDQRVANAVLEILDAEETTLLTTLPGNRR